MKKITLLLTILTLLVTYRATAQNSIFLSHGKIEFERRINQYAIIESTRESEGDNAWIDLQKKAMPQFRSAYFDLLFTGNKTLYRPGREAPGKVSAFSMQMPADENVIWSDLDNEKAVTQKNIYEQLFLIQDSLRHIQWKITDENRVIAGFNCRRANALIMDSIYVVAFYTEEILTPGGPESFTGLPGMILGIALPHQHVTWFATKVEAAAVPETVIVAPVKGKKINNADLKKMLSDRIKDWGKWGRQLMVSSML